MSISSWRWWGLGTAGVLTAIAVTGSLVSGAGGASETVFVPVVPCRLIDTRPGDFNVGPRSAPIGENSPVAFTAWDSGDDDSTCQIPSSATAISTNTTILNPTAASFLSLYPADAAERPDASNLNYATGQAPTPNAVTTPLSSTGQFNVFNRIGTVDVIVDINGYYQPSTSIGATGLTGPQGDTGSTGPQGDTGVGDIGCVLYQFPSWSGTEWECATPDQQFVWHIEHDGVSVDSYTGFNEATSALPAGTRLTWEPVLSTFTGDISACGTNGFFLVVEPNDWGPGSQSIYYLLYGWGLDNFTPDAEWAIEDFFLGPDPGVLYADRVLTWRAGCYTNSEGPVPAFSADIVFTVVPQAPRTAYQ